MATQAVTAKATHVVTISVENGVFDYKNQKGHDVRRLHAQPGETICWRSDHGHFHAMFSDGTPLDHFTFTGKKGSSSDPGVIEHVPADGKPATFKYSVAVSVDHPTKPPLSDDPEIIVG